MDEYEEMMAMLTPVADQVSEMLGAATKVLSDDLIERGEISVQAQLMFSKELNAAADKMVSECEYAAAEIGVELSQEYLESVRRNLISEMLELTEQFVESATQLINEARSEYDE